MTADNPTPKLEPEVAMAMAHPDPRMRRLAQSTLNCEQALANLDAIRAARAASKGKP